MFLYDTIYAFISIIGLVINSVVQILGVRYVTGLTYFKSIIFGFLCGFIFILIFDLLSILNASVVSIDLLTISIMNLMTYSLFWLCYFAFINTGVSALRIRMLRELYDSPDGLTMDEILLRYNSKEIIERRINRLENNKQIKYNNGRYYVIKSITLAMVLIKEVLTFIVLNRKPRIIFNS